VASFRIIWRRRHYFEFWCGVSIGSSLKIQGNRAKSYGRGWCLGGEAGIRWILLEIHHKGAEMSSKRASESRGRFCCAPRLRASVVKISELSNRPAAPVCRRGFRQPDATRKHPVHPIALLIPAAVEFDVPSRLSAQASNGHPSTTCGGRWPGLSPGHDGNGESRSTAPGIKDRVNTGKESQVSYVVLDQACGNAVFRAFSVFIGNGLRSIAMGPHSATC
jgi:hypothetical protein